jgi:hypothetical protein
MGLRMRVHDGVLTNRNVHSQRDDRFHIANLAAEETLVIMSRPPTNRPDIDLDPDRNSAVREDMTSIIAADVLSNCPASWPKRNIILPAAATRFAIRAETADRPFSAILKDRAS